MVLLFLSADVQYLTYAVGQGIDLLLGARVPQEVPLALVN